MAKKNSYSPRGLFNRAISSRVDAQMEWRLRGFEDSLATLKRLTTEMATTIASRLTALEAAALADLDVNRGAETKRSSTPDAS